MRTAILFALAVGTPAAAFAQTQSQPTPPPRSTARPVAIPPVRPAPMPRPVLRYIGVETYEAQGATWARYKYELVNRTAYPTVLWTPAPNLPACGSNINASRGWLDIYNAANGQRLYGYCAATSSNEFAVFGFQVQRGQPTPAQIYVRITDRVTGQTVQSNNAPTN